MSDWASNELRANYARASRAGRARRRLGPGPRAPHTGAPLAIEDTVPNVVSTLLAVQGKSGLQYLDYLDRTVPR